MQQSTSVWILLILYISFTTTLCAQRYVNEEWSTIHALPVNLEWSASLIASSGHLITVGNTFTNGESTNVLLTKMATDGSIVWQVEYDNPDHLEDYGIALCEDDNGNFLVAGTSFRSATSSLDIVVLNYNVSGQLQWSYNFNGSANSNDVPASIATDGTDLVVAGSTESSSTMSDMVTIKLEADGTHAWTRLYDYSALDDAAAKVQMDASTGNITVMGGSAAQANIYDMITLKYSSAGQLTQSHSSDYNVGIDQATCFGLDTNGNAIIGGYYVPGGSEINTSLTSLNDTLGLNWNVFQNPGMEDKIMDLVVAPGGDIYVTGHTEESPGYFKCYTAKYNSQGSLQWDRSYQSPEGGAWGKRITLDDENNVHVAGINVQDGDTNMVTLRYRANGTLDFAQEFSAGAAEIASSIQADPWGNIYVHGTTTVNGNGYATVKYRTAQRSNAMNIDTATSVKYAANEIIVRVHPELVDTSAVDHRGKTFGILSDFVKQEVIDTLNTLYEGAYNFGRMNAFKAFRRFTTANAVSITRTGDTISVPPFWATFILQLPPQLSEPEVAEAFDGKYHVIDFAEVNLLAEFFDLPNDPEFTQGSQPGLEATGNFNFDIQMDRAWDIHPGSPSARLGIFDEGLNWSHEDLSIDGSNTYAGSKVSGGWNYTNNTPISASAFEDAQNSHGSRVAGVAAALRNNAIGIAGVAGGDMSVGNPGCSLYAFDLDFGSVNATAFSTAAEAINEGALGDPGGILSGHKLHVMNLSFGTDLINDDVIMLREAIKFAYDNDCVVVAAAGNTNSDDVIYPATFHEPWVIKVGASDSSGARFSTINEGSTFGNALDLIAPGLPLPNPIALGLHGNPTYNNLYLGIGRTSGATPHVSGSACVLISYVNDHWNPNKLAPDDVEFLFCKYVTEVDGQGYNDTSGFGRLNTGYMMEQMEWPFYWVEHFNGSTTSYNSTLVSSGSVSFNENWNGIAAGNYTFQRYELEFTVAHTLGNATLLDGWIRNGQAHSNLLADDQTWQEGWPAAELVSVTASTATIKGYTYRLINGLSQVVGWYPINPSSGTIKYGYSLHLFDENSTGTNSEAKESGNRCFVYPNPTNGRQRLSLQPSKQLKVDLIDMQGRCIQILFNGNLEQTTELTVNLTELASGLYAYRIYGSRYQQTIPFIIE